MDAGNRSHERKQQSRSDGHEDPERAGEAALIDCRFGSLQTQRARTTQQPERVERESVTTS